MGLLELDKILKAQVCLLGTVPALDALEGDLRRGININDGEQLCREMGMNVVIPDPQGPKFRRGHEPILEQESGKHVEAALQGTIMEPNPVGFSTVGVPEGHSLSHCVLKEVRVLPGILVEVVQNVCRSHRCGNGSPEVQILAMDEDISKEVLLLNPANQGALPSTDQSLDGQVQRTLSPGQLPWLSRRGEDDVRGIGHDAPVVKLK
jgi:hypothetical protein